MWALIVREILELLGSVLIAVVDFATLCWLFRIVSLLILGVQLLEEN